MKIKPSSGLLVRGAVLLVLGTVLWGVGERAETTHALAAVASAVDAADGWDDSETGNDVGEPPAAARFALLVGGLAGVGGLVLLLVGLARLTANADRVAVEVARMAAAREQAENQAFVAVRAAQRDTGRAGPPLDDERA